MTSAAPPRMWRDAAIVAALAVASRVVVVAWAAHRIPPTADGTFYHTIATRIAQGIGYTWLWPDGVVTYAAHYPVGYPAIVALAYALMGPKPVAAMLVNAAIGAAGACATHGVAARVTSRNGALVAGVLAALHVGLVAYVPALMTEGVTASLWIIAAWAAVRSAESTRRRRLAWLALLAGVMAIATLVRPQALALLPVFGWLAARAGEGWRVRLRQAAGVSVVAMALCAPWVVRNHVRMGEAGLSFNGGWNLLIGSTPSANGSWAPLEVPIACRDVFDEARKDSCFGREAARRILSSPGTWVSLVPAKLAVTFDYCGAAGWYLHASNPAAFPYRWKVALGTAETLTERAVLGAAIVAVGWARGPRRRVRSVGALLALVPLFTQHAWLSYIALVPLIGLFGSALGAAALALPAAMAVVGLTALTHAVFFGAGRYGLVVMPFVTALVGGIRLHSLYNPAHGLRYSPTQGVDTHAPD